MSHPYQPCNPCTFGDTLTDDDDLGRCHPMQTTRDCNAPAIPVLSEVNYNPDASDGEYFTLSI